jgi:hypothetical protein
MFRITDDVEEYPIVATDGKEIAVATDNSYIHLGDLFVKKGNDKVIMIINPECDLADQRRDYDGNLPILFITGHLQLITKKLDSRHKHSPITKYFEYDEKQFRIIWDTKSVTSCKYSDFFGWISKDLGYKRDFRLRLPYALEIQRAFAADFLRVGLPVIPPIDVPVKATIYYKDAEKKNKSLLVTTEEDAFVLLKVAKTTTIHFSQTLLFTLREKLASAIAELKGVRDSWSTPADENKKEKLSEYISKLNILVENDGMLRELGFTVIDLPDSHKDLPNSKIRIGKNKKDDDPEIVGSNIGINVEVIE